MTGWDHVPRSRSRGLGWRGGSHGLRAGADSEASLKTGPGLCGFPPPSPASTTRQVLAATGRGSWKLGGGGGAGGSSSFLCAGR